MALFLSKVSYHNLVDVPKANILGGIGKARQLDMKSKLRLCMWNDFIFIQRTMNMEYHYSYQVN